VLSPPAWISAKTYSRDEFAVLLRLAGFAALAGFGHAPVLGLKLAGVARDVLDRAIHELSQRGVVACRGDAYEISDETWASTLARALDDGKRRECHRIAACGRAPPCYT
jgi:hypothetical protein